MKVASAANACLDFFLLAIIFFFTPIKIFCYKIFCCIFSFLFVFGFVFLVFLFFRVCFLSFVFIFSLF